MKKLPLFGCALMFAFTVSSVYAMGQRTQQQNQKYAEDVSVSDPAVESTTVSTVPPAMDSGLDNNTVPAETDPARPNSTTGVPADPQAGIPGQRVADVNSQNLSQP